MPVQERGGLRAVETEEEPGVPWVERNATLTDNGLDALEERMDQLASKIHPGLYRFTRNGLRMAIASIEDETAELYDEWTHNKRMLGNAASGCKTELLDIAAVAMLAWEQIP
jgi:hypothetical protein